MTQVTYVRVTCVDLTRSESGEDGIRTHGRGVSPYTGLANRRYRPLSHLSKLLLRFSLRLIHSHCPPSLYTRFYTRSQQQSGRGVVSVPAVATVTRVRGAVTMSDLFYPSGQAEQALP